MKWQSVKNVFVGLFSYIWRIRSCLVRAALFVIAVCFLTWFVPASRRGWSIQTSDEGISCKVEFEDLRDHFSYFQVELRDQHPSEPYFHGSFYLMVGSEQGQEPKVIAGMMSGMRTYAMTEYDFPLEKRGKNLVTGKSVDGSVVRTEGSPRDFPFDSAKFDFDMRFRPIVDVAAIFVRNLNSSFYVPCETVKASRVGNGNYHIYFEAWRNPLVELTARVLLFGGALFLLAIAFYVKLAAMPTAIASYFFSLWSIRSILASEIKVFPTLLDFMILWLCVALLIVVALRLGISKWSKG